MEPPHASLQVIMAVFSSAGAPLICRQSDRPLAPTLAFDFGRGHAPRGKVRHKFLLLKVDNISAATVYKIETHAFVKRETVMCGNA